MGGMLVPSLDCFITRHEKSEYHFRKNLAAPPLLFMTSFFHGLQFGFCDVCSAIVTNALSQECLSWILLLTWRAKWNVSQMFYLIIWETAQNSENLIIREGHCFLNDILLILFKNQHNFFFFSKNWNKNWKDIGQTLCLWHSKWTYHNCWVRW